MKLRLRISVLILTCASAAAVPTLPATQTRAQETPPKTQEAAATAPAPQTPPVPRTTVAERVIDNRVPGDSKVPGASKAPGESKVPVAGHPVASPKDVKNLYIEPMADDLDQYLKGEFARQLGRRIVIVSKPEDANAVMTGIGEWRNGTEETISGRAGSANGSARGAVQVLSRDRLLWGSEAWGLLKSGSQRKVADRIVHNFKNALEGEKEASGSYY